MPAIRVPVDRLDGSKVEGSTAFDPVGSYSSSVVDDRRVSVESLLTAWAELYWWI